MRFLKRLRRYLYESQKVPATSANLGPGFDVAGLAVTLYNTFVFELLEDGLEITGCPQQFCNQDNLTYRAFVEGAKACGLQFQGLRIECSGALSVVGTYLIQEDLEVLQHVLLQGL